MVIILFMGAVIRDKRSQLLRILTVTTLIAGEKVFHNPKKSNKLLLKTMPKQVPIYPNCFTTAKLEIATLYAAEKHKLPEKKRMPKKHFQKLVENVKVLRQLPDDFKVSYNEILIMIKKGSLDKQKFICPQEILDKQGQQRKQLEKLFDSFEKILQ